MSAISRGDIFLHDFGEPVDARQAGRRPALVIQSDPFNANERYPLAIIMPITTKGLTFHVCVQPDKDNGLHQESFVKCEQIFTVMKTTLEKRLGKLSSEDMERVQFRLGQVLAL